MINGGAMESEQKLKEYQAKTNNDSKFDIDLDFGIHYEKSLAKILSLGKVEVKTERDKWKKTRNIAIELSCNWQKSGLAITEADWWAHILSWKGEVVSVILLPVEKMKEIVKESVSNGNGMIVMGGDNNASEIALIPLEDVVNAF